MFTIFFQNWEKILASAGENGVVLFSMGSYAKGIDERVANVFAGAFAQLSQTVIWKLSGDLPANLTPNVKVVDWLPQNDLLGKCWCSEYSEFYPVSFGYLHPEIQSFKKEM